MSWITNIFKNLYARKFEGFGLFNAEDSNNSNHFNIGWSKINYNINNNHPQILKQTIYFIFVILII